MASQIPQKHELAIAVFYPGNSLMHQVSAWAIKHPNHDFEFSFAQSLPGIRTVLRRTAISIVDATENPAQALAVFNQATAELKAGRIAVYTETMHEGLELLVRARGALLLLGPMSDVPWEGLFERMSRSIGRVPHFGFLTRRTETDAGLPITWLRKHRLETSTIHRLPKFQRGG